jgi:hypothetical protein
MSLLLAIAAQAALAATPPSTVDARALTDTAAALSALGPHPFGSPRDHAAAQFVLARFRESGFPEATTQAFGAGPSSGVNVLALARGRTENVLLVAAHHDSDEQLDDVWLDGGSAALLVEVARAFAGLRPEHTVVFGSFDGGRSTGEGLRHYLESLGSARSLVHAAIVLDPAAAPVDAPTVLGASACGGDPPARASRRLVNTALQEAGRGGARVAFADPAIGLFVQPFERAFRVACSAAPRALGDASIGALVLSNQSFARTAGASRPPDGLTPESTATQPPLALAQAAIRAIRGVDGHTPEAHDSSQWLVVGLFVTRGTWLLLAGLLLLVPGFIAIARPHTTPRVRALRLAHAAVTAALMYRHPEATLFMNALPSLVAPGRSLFTFGASFVPLAALLSVAVVGALAGWSFGSRLNLAEWGALAAGWACLVATAGAPKGSRRRAKKK